MTEEQPALAGRTPTSPAGRDAFYYLGTTDLFTSGELTAVSFYCCRQDGAVVFDRAQHLIWHVLVDRDIEQAAIHRGLLH